MRERHIGVYPTSRPCRYSIVKYGIRSGEIKCRCGRFFITRQGLSKHIRTTCPIFALADEESEGEEEGEEEGEIDEEESAMEAEEGEGEASDEERASENGGGGGGASGAPTLAPPSLGSLLAQRHREALASGRTPPLGEREFRSLGRAWVAKQKRLAGGESMSTAPSTGDQRPAPMKQKQINDSTPDEPNAAHGWRAAQHLAESASHVLRGIIAISRALALAKGTGWISRDELLAAEEGDTVLLSGDDAAASGASADVQGGAVYPDVARSLGLSLTGTPFPPPSRGDESASRALPWNDARSAIDRAIECGRLIWAVHGESGLHYQPTDDDERKRLCGAP